MQRQLVSPKNMAANAFRYRRTCPALKAARHWPMRSQQERIGWTFWSTTLAQSWGEPLEKFPELGWDKVMDTNVKGVFFLTQKLIPLLKASGTAADPARVISIGSIDGLTVSAFETPSYGASKAAVHHLTRFMAKHLTGAHINFNNIAPGPYPTWMLSTGVGFGGKTEGEGVDWDMVGRSNPSGRVGTPEDIAGLTIFLCSHAGAYIVGQTIASDGGIVGNK